VYEESPDWQQVRNDYEYVWAYDVPKFSVPLAGIGEKIYSSGSLEVYRITKALAEPSGAPGRAQDEK